MTEQEWLECGDLQKMLDFLPEEICERKLRLFACACCRRVQHLFGDGWELRALEMAERMADGDEREDWFSEVEQIAVASGMRPAANAVASAVVWWNSWLAVQDVAERPTYAVGLADDPSGFKTAAGVAREKAAQAILLREVVGNPFRPIIFAPAWRTSNVVAIAQGIYEERRFQDIPVLADALEDAGCGEEEVLKHCRAGGEHVRGCWVIDLVLGKE